MEARNEDRIVIRSARIDDWENVKKLAWNTFLKYEAEDYGVEGTRSFVVRLPINSRSVCCSRYSRELIPDTMNKADMNQGCRAY